MTYKQKEGASAIEWTWTPPLGETSIVPPSALAPPANSTVGDRVPQDTEEGRRSFEKTEPHAEAAGASVGREIEGFNARHRFLYEMVTHELRENALGFFEQAFVRVAVEHPGLFDGVAVDGAGELDAIALRRNIVGQEIAGYLRGLDRLLEVESQLARERLGERKGAILKDGLAALREQHLATHRRR